MTQREQPRFLVRFDDICPAMNWDVWWEIECTLNQAGVKPIVAVVPDNRDPELNVGAAREEFWEIVRGWQDKQWDIAIHGYQHLYVTKNSGILGFNRRSEFAGLPRSEQRKKLESGLAIFRHEGIEPAAWIAPAHSFDRHTIDVLMELGIRVISDGLWQYPHRDQSGMLWVPQQLWRFREVPAGMWTVCFHHNRWTASDLKRFRADIARFGNRITTLRETCKRYKDRRKTMADRLVAAGGRTYQIGSQCCEPLRRFRAR